MQKQTWFNTNNINKASIKAIDGRYAMHFVDFGYISLSLSQECPKTENYNVGPIIS